MRTLNCEEIRIAAMARADGERAALEPEEIREHLAVCPECRREVEEMGALAASLARQKRQESAADLWPRIAEQLAQTTGPQQVQPAYAPIWLLALALGTYKLIEFVPDRSWPLLVQLAPAAIAAGWLLWTKQNPFRVDPGLSMEGGN